jgi:benzodiazapine receptor
MTAHALPRWYARLHAPPGTPPRWLFASVWTALYIMIGVAGWLVWKQHGASRPLRLWGWQLAANALWAPAFFVLHSPALALGVMAVMLLLISLTIQAFRPVRRVSAAVMMAYGVWCLYGAYLNVGFWALNQT